MCARNRGPLGKVEIQATMRLLVDGDVFCWQKQGGISRVFREILPRLVALDSSLEIEVVVAGPLTSSGLVGMPLSVRKVPQISDALRPWRFWNPVRDIVNPKLSARFWRRRRADVFVSTYFTSPPLRCPSVCVVYDMVNERFPELFSAELNANVLKRKREAVQKADRAVCISESTQADLIHYMGVDVGKCRVMRLAGSVTSERVCASEPSSDTSAPFLLYVGDYLSPYKNFTFLMNCLCEYWDKYGEDLCLKVVSETPPPADVQKRYADPLRRGRLVFINECPDDRLLSLYANCAALIYPSLYEGFGIPIIEALAGGAPVVCSDIPVFREVAADDAYFFERSSRPAFLAALATALAHGRSAQWVKARRRRAQEFSWDASALCFLEVLREVT